MTSRHISAKDFLEDGNERYIFLDDIALLAGDLHSRDHLYLAATFNGASQNHVVVTIHVADLERPNMHPEGVVFHAVSSLLNESIAETPNATIIVKTIDDREFDIPPLPKSPNPMP